MDCEGIIANGIVSLNHQAVSLMRQGRYAESLLRLKQGLSALMETMAERPGDGCSIKLHDSTQEQSQSVIGVTINPYSVNEDQSRSAGAKLQDKEPCTDAACSAIYSRALVISGSNDDIFSSRGTEELVSGVLLYNIALVHHLNGIRGGKQEQNYRKALRLYDMALCVFQGNPTLLCSSAFLLNLAVANNQSHIYSSLYDISKAEVCLGRLCTILDNIPADCFEGIRDDIHHFLMNLLLLRWQTTVAPAA